MVKQLAVKHKKFFRVEASISDGRMSNRVLRLWGGDPWLPSCVPQGTQRKKRQDVGCTSDIESCYQLRKYKYWHPFWHHKELILRNAYFSVHFLKDKARTDKSNECTAYVIGLYCLKKNTKNVIKCSINFTEYPDLRVERGWSQLLGVKQGY